MKALNILTLSCAVALSSSQLATATPTLRVSPDGGANWLVIQDNGPLDSNPQVGVIKYEATTLGNWSLSISSGQADPFIGTPAVPNMDLITVNNSTTAATLIVQYSDTDLTTFPSETYTNDVAIITDGTINQSVFRDSGNVLFGTTQTYTGLPAGTSPSPTALLLATTGPVSGAASVSKGVVVSAVGNVPNSLTIETVITHTGAGYTSVDAHLYALPQPPCVGKIGDFVWNDLNGNGCQDAGEPGIAGMPVVLYQGCGLTATPIATNTTDASGHYLFTNLCSDTYSVGFTTPTGYKRTLSKVGCVDSSNPDSTSNQTDSKCDCTSGTSCQVCVQLTDANPVNLNVDCGYVLLPDVLCAASTGNVGTPYSSQIVANGGCLPYQNYSIIGGSLPPGLTLNPTNGLITGTPTTAGTYPYVVQVTDNCGNKADTLGENCNITITGCPPCAPHDIQYNFNGTQIIFQPTPGGSYVWFIGDGVVKGLPSNKKVVLHISDQTITIPAVGSSPQYVIPVPDSIITFDPNATQATTTFDAFNNVWLMTFPSSGMSGNVFYGGAAFKVPVAGLPGGIKNVDWKGTFTTDTAGLTVAWQWHAANYKNFTSDYNSIAPKPTDDNSASIYKNSDHAGTPEGTDPSTGQPWKKNVVGGATGGGGSNYTGSGSSTISFPPCVCATP